MAVYEWVRDNEKNYAEIMKDSGCIAHFHSAIEILICEKGSIDININGNLHTLNKGEILINNSYDVHSYSSNSKSIGNVIIIPKNLLKNYFTSINNRGFESNIIKNSICFNHLSALFSIMEYYKSLKFDNTLIITNLSQSAFMIASEYLTLTDKPLSKDTMKDILFYIYNNYLDAIDLKTVSKKFGYTPNHFSYLFNSYMHINLSSFINNLRTEKSAELIKNGASIIDAAENSGFQSLRTFYRCFKKKYGISPREFKFKN